MEKENAAGIIKDAEFIQLIMDAKQNKSEATLKLLKIFEQDIQRISNFIPSSKEDAGSDITLEFLEFIKKMIVANR